MEIESVKIKEKFGRLFGGCPKNMLCDLYRYGAETCRNGSHQYCGKYRLAIELKKQKPLIQPS